MKIKMTPEIETKLREIDAKYDPLIEKYSEIEQDEAPPNPPEGLPMPKIPKMPTGMSVDAFVESRPYKTYLKKLKKHNEDLEKLFDQWVNSGTDRWREARTKRVELINECQQARDEVWRAEELRVFSLIGDDPQAILSDGVQQISYQIEVRYREVMRDVDRVRSADRGQVWYYDVRVDPETDEVRLDEKLTIERIGKTLHLHFDALRDDPERTDLLNASLLSIVRESPYVSSTGSTEAISSTPSGLPVVTTGDKKNVVRPNNYTMTVDKVSNLLFSGDLLKTQDIDLTPVILGKRRKTSYLAYASIDYDELIANKAVVSAPSLNSFDRWVHDGIITNLISGNRTMSIDMIYRAMTGKVDGDVNVSDDLYEKIRDSIHKFNGRVTITNSLEVPVGTTVENGVFSLKEPVVIYTEKEVKLHGRRALVISIPSEAEYDPILLKWARFNGNEIDTRPIRLLNVPGLNNSDDSSTIKMYLYRRIVAMRHSYDDAQTKRKKMTLTRKIRFDSIYDELGKSPTRTEKNRIKEKVEKILKYWTSTEAEKSLISGYTFTKKAGTNQYDGVEILFDKMIVS